MAMLRQAPQLQRQSEGPPRCAAKFQGPRSVVWSAAEPEALLAMPDAGLLHGAQLTDSIEPGVSRGAHCMVATTLQGLC